MKIQYTFPKTNKNISKNNWTSFGSLLSRVPSGDKTFSKFQKDRLKVEILKMSKPFLKPNKMERILNGPSVLLSKSLRGIKQFQDFKKVNFYWQIRIVKHPILVHNKMERFIHIKRKKKINWTPYGLYFGRVPSGDKTFSRFKTIFTILTK